VVRPVTTAVDAFVVAFHRTIALRDMSATHRFPAESNLMPTVDGKRPEPLPPRTVMTRPALTFQTRTRSLDASPMHITVPSALTATPFGEAKPARTVVTAKDAEFHTFSAELPLPIKRK
jgi:hypothetical protein